MTNMTQKDLIVAYRDEGLSYREISEKTGASEQFARTVCSRTNKAKAKMNQIYPDGMCKYCGRQLQNTAGAKQKLFCDDQCRYNYHNRTKRRKPYIRWCKCCGSQFVSYGYPKKRYCSSECRAMAQRGEQNG